MQLIVVLVLLGSSLLSIPFFTEPIAVSLLLLLAMASAFVVLFLVFYCGCAPVLPLCVLSALCLPPPLLLCALCWYWLVRRQSVTASVKFKVQKVSTKILLWRLYL